MTDLVAHRGPHGEGFLYLTPSDGGLRPVDHESPWSVGLGHRRLAILDLTANAAQPMALPRAAARGETRKLWMLFNGEIYNYVELRQELVSAGRVFTSTGDSEVLLAAYDEWGVDCFRRFRGMWSVAIVDGDRGELVLSRDRLGIKPLYRIRDSDRLLLASEIKQFTGVPGIRLRANFSAVADYLVSGYEQIDRTFFEGVEAFEAGTWQRIRLADLEPIASAPYWSPEQITATIDDPNEAAERLRSVLADSVRLQLRSDVPVAVSLSGGLDSSAIATLLSAELGALGIHTFTASFPGDRVDERHYVEEVLARGHFTPHFVTPTPDAFIDELDEFVWQHDEPVGSLSQYAAYRIAREAATNGIHVTLNGQGGDEILAGYWQSYFSFLQKLWRKGQLVRLCSELGGALLPGGNIEALKQPLFLLRRYRQRRSAGGGAPRMLREILSMTAQQQRLFEIRRLFLPRLLRWDDRNLMAFSVEGRYPFLDYRVIEEALSFSPRALYRAGWTKVPLRRAFDGSLPPKILRRRDKQGFETPQERWCRDALAPTLRRFLESDSPVWSIIDRAQAHPQDGTPQPHQTLVRALLVDRWISRFDVRIEEAA